MPIKVLFCYAHEDEALLNKLKTHLRPLQRQGIIDVWYDRDIRAGIEWEQEIRKQLNTADIILLLVSPDFMDSDYCYGTEMRRAIERHQQGEAWVIPVILRHVYWQGVLGKLQALPQDGVPITDPDWYNIDRALFNVTDGIRKVIEELTSKRAASPSPPTPIQPPKPNQESAQSSTPTLKGNPANVVSASKLTQEIPSSSSQSLIKESSLQAPTVNSAPFRKPEVKKLSVGSTIYIYKGHSAMVNTVAWSPDGTYIASGSDDKTVHIWQATTGKHLYTYKGHSSYVSSISWSPDGKLIASASGDKTVHIWQAATGLLLNIHRHHSGMVNTVAWSPNGMWIAGGDDKEGRIWEAATGKDIQTFKDDFYSPSRSYAFRSVSWSPDSTRLVSGSDTGIVHVWETPSGRSICTFKGDSWDDEPLRDKVGYSDIGSDRTNVRVFTVSWSPDGTRIASAGGNRKVHIWKPNAQRLSTYIHSGTVKTATWSPDGTRIASAGDTGYVQVWEVATGKLLYTYNGHSNFVAVLSLAWSPVGTYIASGAKDKTVHIWQAS